MAVTREDVIWCYQNLLGRDAESEATIESHLAFESVKNLVASFVRSPEFAGMASAASDIIARQHLWLLADSQQLQIDANASNSELEQCAAVIKNAWQAEGLKQAHFSVLSNEEFLPSNHYGVDSPCAYVAASI